MAENLKTSQLPEAAELDGTELVPVVQGGADKVTTPAAITAGALAAAAAANVAAAAANTNANSRQLASERGAVNGYCPLDAGQKVPIANLPATVVGAVDYQGAWNASTNSPNLGGLSPSKGDYYIVSVAGATSLGGITSWAVGDWAIYNGAAWQKVHASGTVTLADIPPSATNGHVMTTVAGAVAWAAPTGGGGGGATVQLVKVPINYGVAETGFPLAQPPFYLPAAGKKAHITHVVFYLDSTATNVQNPTVAIFTASDLGGGFWVAGAQVIPEAARSMESSYGRAVPLAVNAQVNPAYNNGSLVTGFCAKVAIAATGGGVKTGYAIVELSEFDI